VLQIWNFIGNQFGDCASLLVTRLRKPRCCQSHSWTRMERRLSGEIGTLTYSQRCPTSLERNCRDDLCIVGVMPFWFESTICHRLQKADMLWFEVWVVLGAKCGDYLGSWTGNCRLRVWNERGFLLWNNDPNILRVAFETRKQSHMPGALTWAPFQPKEPFFQQKVSFL
jgi:hypothetical protein